MGVFKCVILCKQFIMDQIILTATRRTSLGKKNDKLRKEGKLPGVLYGHGLETLPIQVSEKDFLKVFKKAGENTLVNLSIDGSSRPVLVHDVQHHYLDGQLTHVDFYAVRMDEKLHAKIPLHFVGESAAVKNLGGVLVKTHQELEVECLPADLPPFIEVNLANLITFDDVVRISDLTVSDKVKILADPDDLVVAVTPPRSEEELKELEAAPVAEDVSKVEGLVKEEPVAAVAEEGPAKVEKKIEKE